MARANGVVFWNVYLPQAKPILAALAIIQFVGSWNNYESPLIMLSTEARYTLPLGLTVFVDADEACRQVWPWRRRSHRSCPSSWSF